MTRTVSLTKPHLFLSPRGWVCCQAYTRLGWGESVQGAYADWMSRNSEARP